MESTVTKPPLGVMPRKFWEEVKKRERASEILEAVARYVLAGKTPPIDWLLELNDYGVVVAIYDKLGLVDNPHP